MANEGGAKVQTLKIDVEKIAAGLKQRIASGQVRQDTPRMARQEALKALKPVIDDLRVAQASFRLIQQYLAEEGLQVSIEALKALAGSKRSRKGAASPGVGKGQGAGNAA